MNSKQKEKLLSMLASPLFAVMLLPVSCLGATPIVSETDRRIVANGDMVHYQFGLVVETPGEEKPHSFISLQSIKKKDALKAGQSLWLSAPEGPIHATWTRGKETYSREYGRFKVIDKSDKAQIINVTTWASDGDWTHNGRYEVTKDGHTLISSHLEYFGHFLQAIVYAAAFCFVFFVLANVSKWLWLRQAKPA